MVKGRGASLRGLPRLEMSIVPDHPERGPVDFEDIYRDDPLQRRTLDWFARRLSQNLLGRLKRAGLKPSHRILDYGCGPGVFSISYVKKATAHWGYDPYVPGHTNRPVAEAPFDCIVLNDTIEHCEDVRGVIQSCLELLPPAVSSMSARRTPPLSIWNTSNAR